jgi:adhesin/invasin
VNSVNIPVSGACFAATLPSGVAIKAPLPPAGSCAVGSFPTDAAGKASVKIITTVAGTYPVGAAVGASPVPTTPGGSVFTRDAVFVGGPPSSATIGELISAHDAVPANGVSTADVRGALRDQTGNAAQCWSTLDPSVEVGCPVFFNIPVNTWVGSGSAKVTGPAVVRVYTSTAAASKGIAVLQLLSTTAGTHDVTADFHSDPAALVGQWPFKHADGAEATGTHAVAHASFTAGRTDPGAHSLLSIPTAAGGVKVPVSTVSGEGHTVRVYIADQFDGPDGNGNPLAGQSVRISWKPVGGADSSLRTAQGVTGADGTRQFIVGSATAGDFEFRAYVQLQYDWNGHVAGSWVEVGGSPATAGYKAGHPSTDGAHLFLVAPTGAVAADGVATQVVKLVARDLLGNPASCNTNGTPAGGCAVVWDTTTDAALAAALAATGATKAQIVSADTVTNVDGEATLVIRSTKAGNFNVGASVQVGATASNMHVLGVDNQAPAVIGFTAGQAVLGNSSLTVTPTVGTGPVVANGTDTYTLKVEVKDAYGNLTQPADNVFFYVARNATDPINTVTTIHTAAVNGVATVTLSRTEAAEYWIWATFGSWHNEQVIANKVAGSPQAAEFVAGAPDLNQSIITSSRKYVEANQDNPAARGTVDQAVLTVTLKDASGNTVTGCASTVRVESSLAGVSLANNGLATCDATTGLYSLAVTSPDDGAATFKFTVNGGHATNQAGVTFVPTPAKPQTDRPKPSGTTTPEVGKVTLTAATGTGTPGMRIGVTKTGAPNVSLCTTTVVVKADGTWTCLFKATADLAHTHQIEVRQWDPRFESEGTDPVTGVVSPDFQFKSEPKLATVDGTTPGDTDTDPSNGTDITGTIPGGTGGEDHEVIVIDKETGEELCRAPVNPDGSYSCTVYPPLEDGQEVVVIVEDEAGNQSGGENIVVDALPPTGPPVYPSDGTEITGNGEAGNTVTITTPDGNPVCTATVGSDGHWSCTPSFPLKPGDTVVIVETDPAGNVSDEVNWRIGIPELTLSTTSLMVGDRMIATAINFQPGEKVNAIQYSTDPYVIGTKTADSNGTVVWSYIIPQGTAVADHEIVATGQWSEKAVAGFEVIDRLGPAHNPSTASPAPARVPGGRLPFTGSADLIGVAGAALGTLLTGLLLLLAARRRRQEQTQA